MMELSNWHLVERKERELALRNREHYQRVIRLSETKKQHFEQHAGLKESFKSLQERLIKETQKEQNPRLKLEDARRLMGNLQKSLKAEKKAKTVAQESADKHKKALKEQDLIKRRLGHVGELLLNFKVLKRERQIEQDFEELTNSRANLNSTVKRKSKTESAGVFINTVDSVRDLLSGPRHQVQDLSIEADDNLEKDVKERLKTEVCAFENYIAEKPESPYAELLGPYEQPAPQAENGAGQESADNQIDHQEEANEQGVLKEEQYTALDATTIGEQLKQLYSWSDLNGKGMRFSYTLQDGRKFKIEISSDHSKALNIKILKDADNKRSLNSFEQRQLLSELANAGLKVKQLILA